MEAKDDKMLTLERYFYALCGTTGKLTHIRIMFQKSQPRLLYLGSCFLADMFAYVCRSELLRSQANCDPLVLLLCHLTDSRKEYKQEMLACRTPLEKKGKKLKSVCQLRTLVRNVQGRLQREGVEKVAM